VADRVGIEWTETTWKPTTGCDRTSLGCDNCYELALAKRLKSESPLRYDHRRGSSCTVRRLSHSLPVL